MGGRATQEERILLTATMRELQSACARQDHPEREAAKALLGSTNKESRCRYRSAIRFAKPEWIERCLTDTPRCGRFLRPELRRALDRRIREHADSRYAILERWLGADEIARRWPCVPNFVPLGEEMALAIDDPLDRLTLELINLRGVDEKAGNILFFQAALVREAVRDVASEDAAFVQILPKLWKRITRLMPTPTFLQRWVIQSEHRPWQSLGAKEVAEIHEFEPSSGMPLMAHCYRAVRKKDHGQSPVGHGAHSHVGKPRRAEVVH